MNHTLNNSTEKKLNTSQAYFNPLLLYFYDWLVFSFVAKYCWGVSVDQLLEPYTRLIRKMHLEVGVGTGYLLDKLDPDNTDIDLMDLSENCLKKTRRRLKRFTPSTFVHNILEPYITATNRLEGKYESISLNFVMHCVPGNFDEKSIAFGHLKKLLSDKGVLFGVTVVAKDNKAKWFAKPVMWLLNTIGLFNNRNDHPDDLRSGLEAHFRYVSVKVVSATAFFIATNDEAVFNNVVSFYV
jgi:Methyltransferase domain.